MKFSKFFSVAALLITGAMVNNLAALNQADLDLINASAGCDAKMAVRALDAGANVNVQVKGIKTTPLLMLLANLEGPRDRSTGLRNPSACQAVFELLIEAGADVTIPDRFGDSPLSIAIKREGLDLPLVEASILASIRDMASVAS